MPHPICNVILLAAVSLSAAAQSTAPAQAKPAANQDPAKVEAFSAAVRKGDLATVKALLDAGVDVNTKFRYDATALAFASDRGFVEIVKLLIERGADVNAKDTFYNGTPLVWASGPAQARTPGHAEVVRLLLKAGATGAAGALAAAVYDADAPMVKVILEHGGLPAQALTNALETALAAKKPEIVTLLEAAGAKPAPAVTLSAEQLARFEGTYESANGQLMVKVAEGRLVVDASRLGGPAELALKPRSETEFISASPEMTGVRLLFQLESGKVVSVMIGPTKYTRRGGSR